MLPDKVRVLLRGLAFELVILSQRRSEGPGDLPSDRSASLCSAPDHFLSASTTTTTYPVGCSTICRVARCCIPPLHIVAVPLEKKSLRSFGWLWSGCAGCAGCCAALVAGVVPAAALLASLHSVALRPGWARADCIVSRSRPRHFRRANAAGKFGMDCRIDLRQQHPRDHVRAPRRAQDYIVEGGPRSRADITCSGFPGPSCTATALARAGALNGRAGRFAETRSAHCSRWSWRVNRQHPPSIVTLGCTGALFISVAGTGGMVCAGTCGAAAGTCGAAAGTLLAGTAFFRNAFFFFATCFATCVLHLRRVRRGLLCPDRTRNHCQHAHGRDRSSHCRLQPRR